MVVMWCSSRIIGATAICRQAEKGGELRKIGGPVIQEPGAPEGAPAQPAITHYREHKKAPAIKSMALLRLKSFDPPRSFAEYAATGGDYRSDFKTATVG